MRKEFMLHIKLIKSELRPQFKWSVNTTLKPGQCLHIKAPNGMGKTTFLQELKYQWPELFPTVKLGFTDQAPLAPFQDLTVATTMDILWEVTPHRHAEFSWRNLAHWKSDEIQSWLNKAVSKLSGGENQWIKILMMLSLESDVWLLDEPFQSLDQKRQKELWQILEDWLQKKRYLVLVHHGDLPLSLVETAHMICSAEGLMLEPER